MYTPTKITGFDVDNPDEKIIKPAKIETNFNLIGQETKTLNDSIRENQAVIALEADKLEQESSSFRKHFLSF